MKKITLLLIIIASVFAAQAQDKEKGISYYNYQKYQSAIQELSPLSEKDDYANYYLGLSYIDMEEFDKAKSIFKRFPEDPANMAGQARILFLEEKDEEAKSMLENVIRKASRRDKRPYLYAADAVTYTDGGDVNKALEWYDYYLEWKKSGNVLIRKGDAYRKQMDGGKAMTAYQNAAEQGGDASLSCYKQGNLWYASKTYDSALANYNRAAALDPNNPLPYYDLSMAYYRVNRYDEAKKQIEKYLALSDKSPEDKMQYANILYLSQDYDGAIQKMNELLNAGVEKTYMYRVLGYSYQEKGDSANALKNMDIFFKKHPQNKLIPQDYFTYGKILAGIQGREAEAGTYFEKGIASDTATDKVPILREVADAYKSAGDYANAAIWYEKITNAPESPSKEILDYWWAGRSYYQVSNYTKAAEMYTKMVERRPDEPSGHYWLAKVAAAQDPEYTTGAANELFKKYIPMAVGDSNKIDELVNAYTYLAVVAYNQKNYSDAKLYSEKIIALKPENGTAKQILANIPK